MAYLDTRPMTPARLWSVGIVVVLHAALLWALITGTYRDVIDTVTKISTYNVPVIVPPEPVDPLPTPLPKQAQTPTPIMAPKPVIDVPTTPSEIRTTPTVPPVTFDTPPPPVPIIIAPTAPITIVAEPSGSATRATRRSGSISDDDYPPAAVRAEEQGRSTATFTIGTDGRVSSCSAAGAGPILDAETCKLIQRRFRFTAAKDAGGSPVAETKTQSIEWRLPR